MKLIERLDRLSPKQAMVLGALAIALIGVVDLYTGYEIGFSIFYVLPISLAAWVAGSKAGYLYALISAIVWLSADFLADHIYSSDWIPLWNTSIRLTYFIVITRLLGLLKAIIRREQALAREDHLTGAANARSFYERAQIEIERIQRKQAPLTLVYTDLDNFKQLNDEQGHRAGDLALKIVVETMKKELRKTDMVARLGGDEFALLLPDTDEPSARKIIDKLHSSLLEKMKQQRWPVTFSMGVLICTETPENSDVLIKQADALMYQVKKSSKNSIRYGFFGRLDSKSSA